MVKRPNIQVKGKFSTGEKAQIYDGVRLLLKSG